MARKGKCFHCKKEYKVKDGLIEEHKRPGKPPLKPYPGGDKCPGSGKAPHK